MCIKVTKGRYKSKVITNEDTSSRWLQIMVQNQDDYKRGYKTIKYRLKVRYKMATRMGFAKLFHKGMDMKKLFHKGMKISRIATTYIC